MTDTPNTGVVVDTNVISWMFNERPNPWRNVTGASSVRDPSSFPSKA
jgi:rRNA-processing protein FCF1